MIGAAIILASFFYFGPALLQPGDDSGESIATFTVAKRQLIDTVIEQGTLESQSKVDGVCELHGWQNKITFIVEEGASVEKGDVVVKFDASEIETEIAEQKIATNNERAAVDEAREQIEVQKNLNESTIAAAKLEKQLAELDLEKYIEGDYKAELADIERSIAESDAALEQKSEELKNMRILVKKGYREPERIRQMEQAEKSAQFQLERDEQKKEVLTKFTYKRQITELQSKSDEAARKLSRAEATARAEISKAKLKLASAEKRLMIEEKELKEEEDQLEKAVIKAPHSGTVAYANHRYMDPGFKIRAGGNVHRRQTVFHLPDMNKMQVQLDVHESLINKLSVGQRAIIQVESFPDQKFNGRIKKIADLARSDGNFEEKKYTAIVTIDEFPPETKLKPGMTAEVEIHVRTLQDVIAIPVQTVTQIAGEEYAYLSDGKRFHRVKVEVSEGNEAFLVVNDGLEIGAKIAMDAYQRGLEDIETEDLESVDNDDQKFANVDPVPDDDESKQQDESADSPSVETETVDSNAKIADGVAESQAKDRETDANLEAVSTESIGETSDETKLKDVEYPEPTLDPEKD